MFHATHEACCLAIFNQPDCKRHNRGCAVKVLEPTVPNSGPKLPPANADCVVPGWHPNEDGCSNDDLVSSSADCRSAPANVPQYRLIGGRRRKYVTSLYNS